MTGESRTGQDLYLHARQLIPGGGQLLSKRPEMFLPDEWPAYFSHAKGAETWDLDGRCYVDMTHFGVGCCVLGFADPEVDTAVVRAIGMGTMTSLNCPEEVELAELLVEIHPWAEQVRFSRSGGEAMAIAVRIVRAASGRDVIAFCGYHGWHDWYLAANLRTGALDQHLLTGLSAAGVPQGLAGTVIPFQYNDIDHFRRVLSEHGSRLAAIVMEPARSELPKPGFLEEIRAEATRAGVVLVFDEITSGWRMNSGGIHLTYGVTPDVVVFAKAMSNGYPMAAVMGRRDVMEAAQRSFISSTYWTERIGPAAAIATITKHRRDDVAAALVSTGEEVQRGWKDAAEHHGLTIHVSGLPPLSHFELGHDAPLALSTLFVQEMLDRGYLASPAFYASAAHEPHHVKGYLDAVDGAFAVVASAVERGDAEGRLRGPVRHVGFQRLA